MSRRVTSITEEIESLKRKIALLDGDWSAYYENSQWEMEKNRQKIARMREQNKLLRKKLSRKMAADDDVISSVFKSHGKKPPAELRGLTGETAVSKFDQTVCEVIKHRNALQHTARNKQQVLEQLTRQLAHLEEEEVASNTTSVGENVAAKKLRELENRLDRAIIQCNEAVHIRNIYDGILEKMAEEQLHYDNEISDLEKAIQIRRKDLTGLKRMKEEADKARDTARVQLSSQEQSVADNKRQRERVLNSYRQQADQKKEFADKVDRRRRISLAHHDSLGQLSESEPDTGVQEEQEQKISSFEEAFAKIKDATGVSDIQEVVARFLNQGETRKHLEQLREEHTQQLARMKEERDKLQAQFEEMKYSGEAKMSSGQRIVEEFQTHLDTAKNKQAESKDAADRACRLLAQVKSGVAHLTEKLHSVKTPHTHMLKPKLDPKSEEYVLDQLGDCEQKLMGLVEELSSRDLDTVHKEMEDEEFRHTVEGGIPGNIHVTVSKTATPSGLYDDDSGSDDEAATRENMKRETKQLVESKTKKPQDDDDEDDGKKRKRRR